MPAEPKTGHLRNTEPAAWVRRFAPLVRPDGPVLDVACGNGRHGRLFLDNGHPATLVDRDTGPVADLAERAEVVTADLEAGGPWPFDGRTFAAVVVVNYLYRPLFPDLLAALEPGGVLIYETFAEGNEAYSKPRNPDHLLAEGELLRLAGNALRVVAYEHGLVQRDACPGVVQRVCAVRGRDGEPQRLA